MASQTADDVPLVVVDVRQIMDQVHREVTELLLEGVQKAAHICAAECAKQVVAARREMYQHFQAQQRGPSPLSAPLSAPRSPAVASSLPVIPGPIRSMASPTAVLAGSQAGGHAAPEAPQPSQDLQPNGSAVARSNTTPRTTPQSSRTPMSTLNGGSYSPVSDTLVTSGGAYDTYIDTQDAVQSLEDRTRRAARAMDLVEEAIQLAANAADSMAAEVTDKMLQDLGGSTEIMQPPGDLIMEAKSNAKNEERGDALTTLAKTLCECPPLPLSSAAAQATPNAADLPNKLGEANTKRETSQAVLSLPVTDMMGL